MSIDRINGGRYIPSGLNFGNGPVAQDVSRGLNSLTKHACIVSSKPGPSRAVMPPPVANPNSPDHLRQMVASWLSGQPIVTAHDTPHPQWMQSISEALRCLDADLVDNAVAHLNHAIDRMRASNIDPDDRLYHQLWGRVMTSDRPDKVNRVAAALVRLTMVQRSDGTVADQAKTATYRMSTVGGQWVSTVRGDRALNTGIGGNGSKSVIRKVYVWHQETATWVWHVAKSMATANRQSQKLPPKLPLIDASGSRPMVMGSEAKEWLNNYYTKFLDSAHINRAKVLMVSSDQPTSHLKAKLIFEAASPVVVTTMGRDQMLALTKDVLSGCRTLHQKGLAHGDIKMGNVVMDDSTQRAQLIDFDGLSAATHGPLASTTFSPYPIHTPQCKVLHDLFGVGLLWVDWIYNTTQSKSDRQVAYDILRQSSQCQDKRGAVCHVIRDNPTMMAAIMDWVVRYHMPNGVVQALCSEPGYTADQFLKLLEASDASGGCTDGQRDETGPHLAPPHQGGPLGTGPTMASALETVPPAYTGSHRGVDVPSSIQGSGDDGIFLDRSPVGPSSHSYLAGSGSHRGVDVPSSIQGSGDEGIFLDRSPVGPSSHSSSHSSLAGIGSHRGVDVPSLIQGSDDEGIFYFGGSSVGTVSGPSFSVSNSGGYPGASSVGSGYAVGSPSMGSPSSSWPSGYGGAGYASESLLSSWSSGQGETVYGSGYAVSTPSSSWSGGYGGSGYASESLLSSWSSGQGGTMYGSGYAVTTPSSSWSGGYGGSGYAVTTPSSSWSSGYGGAGYAVGSWPGGYGGVGYASGSLLSSWSSGQGGTVCGSGYAVGSWSSGYGGAGYASGSFGF